jgi:hypothetical protein
VGIRSNLRREQKALGRRPSVTQITKIHDTRRRLSSRIKNFHKTADLMWGNIDPDEEDFMAEADQDDDEVLQSDDYDGISLEDDSLEDYTEMEAQPAEDMRLLMPSALGAAYCHRKGQSSLLDQEIKLREGQANDALEELRLALVEKSLIYRTEVRAAKNHKMVTRAWSGVHRAEATIQKHVRTYRQAHQALKNLDANTPQFRPIRKEELKMSGDIIEENRFGQKKDILAWFWKMGPKKKPGDNSWMEECKILLFLHVLDS